MALNQTITKYQLTQQQAYMITRFYVLLVVIQMMSMGTYWYFLGHDIEIRHSGSNLPFIIVNFIISIPSFVFVFKFKSWLESQTRGEFIVIMFWIYFWSMLLFRGFEASFFRG